MSRKLASISQRNKDVTRDPSFLLRQLLEEMAEAEGGETIHIAVVRLIDVDDTTQRITIDTAGDQNSLQTIGLLTRGLDIYRDII